MKKHIRIIALALCAVLGATLFTACTSGQKKSDSTDSSSAQIPNPWEECQSLEDAATLAGFDYQLPTDMDELGMPDYIGVIKDDMMELVWQKDGSDKICLRKGTQQDDISGDHTDYATTKTAEIVCDDETVTVTFKSNADGIHLALWQQGGYSYSAFSSKGLTEQDATSYVTAILEANGLPMLDTNAN